MEFRSYSHEGSGISVGQTLRFRARRGEEVGGVRGREGVVEGETGGDRVRTERRRHEVVSAMFGREERGKISYSNGQGIRARPGWRRSEETAEQYEVPTSSLT